MNKEEIFTRWQDPTIEQLQEENKRLKNNNKTLNMQKEEAYKIADNYYKENKDLQQRINKATEYNKQIIEDTKSFYRPTSDTIYSGDCLIDIAEQNISILEGKE